MISTLNEMSIKTHHHPNTTITPHHITITPNHKTPHTPHHTPHITPPPSHHKTQNFISNPFWKNFLFFSFSLPNSKTHTTNFFVKQKRQEIFFLFYNINTVFVW